MYQPTMLRLVAEASGCANVFNLSLHHAGFLTFERPPRSVDLVATRFALHHLPDFWKQLALLRIFSMLKPNGILYLQDVIFAFKAEDASAKVEAWIDATSSYPGFSRAECERHIREEYSTFAWVLEGMLEGAGFVVETREFVFDTFATYVCRAKQVAADSRGV
jgi:ubiquinone/menaquinone biosynthesis C-methylase UbiE